MKANEVLNLLRITRPTLTKYVKEGIIKVDKLPNGRYEYDSNSVYSFLNKDVKRKTYIYARVSTSKQKADLDNQIELLKQFCFTNGYVISGIYSDIASGISFEKRNNFFKMLDDIIDNIDNQISVIVIGQNKEWKQSSSLSKKINQHFVQIPFARFIQMIQYKAKEKGIAVILTEESYTSGTSFIDDEMPVKVNYNKARRIHRGLFKSNNNILINADLNGAYQILKKVFPIKWDRGCALHPFVVNIA